MITSLTTRYRVVFTLSLVLCVLLVSGVPVDAKSTSIDSAFDSDSVNAFRIVQDNPFGIFLGDPSAAKELWDNYVDSVRRGIEEFGTGHSFELNGKQYVAVTRGWGRAVMIELPPEPERASNRGRTRESTREPIRTESCRVKWGNWYVDVITHVIPKLQINTLTNVTTGMPVMGKLSVTTKYTEKRDGKVICRVYNGGVYSHSYSRGTRTETRQRERTDYNSIKVIDHTGDLTVLRINETSGDLVLQWSNRYDAYRVHVDVVLFEGSLKQNLPVQVYIWPNGQTTSAIKVETYRSVRVN